MHPLIEWTAAALIVIAAFFLLVGAIGLARLPDFFMRKPHQHIDGRWR